MKEIKKLRKWLIFGIVVIVILSLSLFAYSKFSSKSTTYTEGQETLLAQECGMDGLKCCANEPKCSFGQECCVNPRNAAENYCADKCGLGSDGQFCRDNEECDTGFSCRQGKCAKCGGENQGCCGATGGNNICDTGKNKDLVCYQEKCVTCGKIGNPCCGDKCDKTDKMKELAQCFGNICVACGGDGQASCLTGDKCVKDLLFSNEFCYGCGLSNQPCCEGNKCKSNDLSCERNFCRSKQSE